MSIAFDHQPHPRIAARTKTGPPRSTDERVGFNGRFALVLTTAVGTMWCAYLFAILALVALPDALGGGLLPLIQWVSQTFIQLVMLSVIMVGQNILSRAADKRADMTYRDAEAILHEAQQVQAHLKVQDDALNQLLDKVAKLEAALARATNL
jgi:predicted DNA repair protein MutK